MQRKGPRNIVLATVIGVQAMVIGTLLLGQHRFDGAKSMVTKEPPARVEAIPNSKLKQVTLTAKAAERLGVKTATVGEEAISPPRPLASIKTASAGAAPEPALMRKVVPYAAVLYDLDGSTWVYTNPKSLTYIRHQIKVDFITGDRAAISEGPAVGTTVVTDGTIEIFGAEFKVGN